VGGERDHDASFHAGASYRSSMKTRVPIALALSTS
jgi:hypothetical protein